MEWLRELNEKICMKGLMVASKVTWQLRFQLFLLESIVLQVKTSFNNIFKFLQISKSKTTFRTFSWWDRKVNQCIFNLTRIFPQEIKTCWTLINLVDHLPNSSIPWVFWLIKILCEGNVTQLIYLKMKCFYLCAIHGHILLVDIIYCLCKRQY